ncbi:uncharacterized protein LOC107615616 [Arachis ipaensis]|uniref:uncharacterized protein LOC107615616 n=1 Tax=Arachis ipaensis TaxID=130454 RepID=UPI0007AF6923|nr:uncharacterized protein LOC107615616 [Arachis ipaensis]XP_025678515.1 uncharacterized protein LOC112778412 [Arachis hypogaea]
MGATPFHPSILKVWLPKNFDKATDMRYDGTKDPQEHITAFEARMNLEGVGEAVRYRAFPVTLAGPAIRWFNALPQGSITAFADIAQSFLARFTTRIAKEKHPINLLGVTQKPGEPTRKFLDKFNDECLEIDGLTDSVASLCLTNGLLNEDFRKHLTTKLSGPCKKSKAWPRNTSMMRKPRPLKERTGDNKSLYCDYHKGFGHKTQDYFNLKDALEHAIREGKLSKFSRLIRELRRQEQEHSEKDRSRTVKPRQEPMGDANNPQPSWSTSWSGVTALLNPNRQQRRIPGNGRSRLVRRILVDMGADSNILFRNVFDAMGLKESDLKNHQH